MSPPSLLPSRLGARLLPVLLLATLPLGGCAFCDSVASERTEHVAFDAATAKTLIGRTHNGDITLRAGSEPGRVHGTARLVGWGPDPEAADAVLERMQVVAAAEGDTARIGLAWTVEPGHCESGTIHFDLEVPPEWSLDLESHNGDFALRGVGGNGLQLETHNGNVHLDEVSGAVRFRTHNGDAEIRGSMRSLAFDSHNGGLDVVAPLDALKIDSHNGPVRVRVTGDGELAGTIETHNGGVRVDAGSRTVRAVLGSDHRVSVDAEGATVLQADSEHATVLAGAGVTAEGEQLRVRTHNGSIAFRHGARDN